MQVVMLSMAAKTEVGGGHFLTSLAVWTKLSNVPDSLLLMNIPSTSSPVFAMLSTTFANLAQRRLARGGNVVGHFVDIFIEGIEVGFRFDELFAIPIDDERGNFDAKLGANVLGNGRG